jgi:uncharacterized protein (TIGR03000 family)
MRKRILLAVGVSCLALLWTAGTAQAQRYGGGGRAYGGYGGRSYSGGYGRGYYGGYGYGGYGRGYGGYRYANGFALGFGLGYGLGGYPLGFPYYGSYFNFPYTGGYFNYPSAYSGGTYVPDYRYSFSAPLYFDATGPATSTYQSFYTGQTPTVTDTCRVHVVVPVADAQVLFDGTPTKQQGTERDFVTPPLSAGREFHYTISASWTENGQRVNRERRITVTPGSQVVVNFQGPSR